MFELASLNRWINGETDPSITAITTNPSIQCKQDNAQQGDVVVSIRFGLYGAGLAFCAMSLVLSGCSLNFSATPNTTSQTPANGVYNDMPVPETLVDINTVAASGLRSPFNNLLEPKVEPNVSDPNANKEQAVEPPSDPFQGLALAGLLYKGNRSSAILKIEGIPTQIVHIGDVLKTEHADIKVASITNEGLHLVVLNPASTLPKEMRRKTFNLPSLVGYRSSSSGSAKGSKPTEAQTANPNASGLGALEQLINSQSATNTTANPANKP